MMPDLILNGAAGAFYAALVVVLANGGAPDFSDDAHPRAVRRVLTPRALARRETVRTTLRTLARVVLAPAFVAELPTVVVRGREDARA